ncbi:acireductone dioxygenase [Methylococcus sp. EFPC2]|uniref:1,2-dihydroxy-3-keto-5-methylthiopentene dioxygenase n=1 Tax=Methylococcus sp. EFPC2 TaxID=2812648 RepID=UPI001968117D|nr:cupin [Methylococcus sp. EFPC2]QSA97249.1 cupin [Methylococcus sp. EFPC2]
MSILSIHPEDKPGRAELIREPEAIAERLAQIGVRFERWSADRDLGPEASQDDILGAYKAQVTRLQEAHGFQSADVISIAANNPQKAELRAKFLNEHTHSEFEVRFFVEGRGLFYLHPDDHVYGVLCERGDLLSVPAHVKHWFDLGAEPELKCIRLFTTPEGWVAEYTGSDIAEGFPRLEAFLKDYA